MNSSSKKVTFFFSFLIVGLVLSGCKAEFGQSTPKVNDSSLISTGNQLEPAELAGEFSAKENKEDAPASPTILESIQEFVRVRVGLSVGDDRFEKNIDFNADDTISGLDLVIIKAFPRVGNATSVILMVDNLVKSQVGRPDFDSNLDVNHDGVLSGLDRIQIKAELTKLFNEDVKNRVEEHVRNLVGKKAGDSEFETNLDFNRDGEISGLDRVLIKAFPKGANASAIVTDVDNALKAFVGMSAQFPGAYDVNLDGQVSGLDRIQVKSSLQALCKAEGTCP